MAQVAEFPLIRYCLEFPGGISDSLRSGIKSVQNMFTFTNRIDTRAKCSLRDRCRSLSLLMVICKMLGLNIVDPDNKTIITLPLMLFHTNMQSVTHKQYKSDIGKNTRKEIQ